MDHIAEFVNSHGGPYKGTQPISDGMVWLLRISGNGKYVSRIGQVDKKKTSDVYVEAVEATEDKGKRTDFTRYLKAESL
ncbi:hypothetical protein MU1_00150 [Paenibacillus glycanilyticus]|uniref:Uncharacterized protein n=1 Tax=Paenibacillus glycanilyticus TaxID=126569 RepID=A0ABQ6G3X1_9BACL|nr:hypothetical protein MU1_00150 [Paenibacillus glycanilyticus]